MEHRYVLVFLVIVLVSVTEWELVLSQIHVFAIMDGSVQHVLLLGVLDYLQILQLFAMVLVRAHNLIRVYVITDTLEPLVPLHDVSVSWQIILTCATDWALVLNLILASVTMEILVPHVLLQNVLEFLPIQQVCAMESVPALKQTLVCAIMDGLVPHVLHHDALDC